MAEFASKGVAGTALGLGAGALGIELLRGGMGGLLGGNCGAASVGGCCSENTPATRWDINQSEKMADKDMEIATLRAINISKDYTDAAIVNLNDRTSARIAALESRVNSVETYAAVNTATMGCLEQQIRALQGLTKVVIPSTNVCNNDYPVVVANTACNPVITKAVTTA